MINRSIRANLVSASDLFVVKNLTPGLAESGKALVLDNNKDIAGIRNLSVQNLNVGGSLLTASAAEINTVDTTPGTAQAGKALIFDINIDISNIHSLSASNLFGTLQTASQPHITSLGTLTGLSTNSLTLNGTLITASAAKLNYNNINIAGIAEANKALILDTNRNITNINSLNAINLLGTLETANQPNITTLTGVTLIGSSDITEITGTLQTASQPNITSLPGIISIGSSDNTDITGTLQTASQPNITTLAGIVSIGLNNNTTLTGTLQTASQPNITSVGTLTSLSTGNITLNGSLITATANELNYNHITAIGTASASKALILDSNKDISGIHSLSATNLTGTLQTANQPNITTLSGIVSIGLNDSTTLTGTLLTASQPNITSVGTLTSLSTGNITLNGSLITATATEINYNDITAIGTAEASKALIVDSNKNISSINSLSATNITGILQTANQPNITTLSGIVSIGLNDSTTLTGTLQTASQPNITSVGTLNSLSTGNITLNGSLITATATKINYNDITAIGTAEASKALIVDSNKDISSIRNLSATNLTGTLQTANQPNITTLSGVTSVGLNDSTTVTGTLLTANQPNITTLNSVVSVGLNNSTTVTGTLQTASQPNITTLSGVTSVGLNNSTTVTGTLQTVSQPNITTLSGVTSVGLNNSTTITGTLLTASQPNITTLSGVTTVGLNDNTSLIGKLQTASQTHITSVGTLTNLSTGDITLNGSLITATAAEINYNDVTAIGTAEASKALIVDSNKDISSINSLSATNLTGTLLTASQPNITTLSGVTSVGASNAAAIIGTLQTASQPNITTLSGITSVGLNNSTTLTGTLQTASQPNITTLAGVTSVGLNNSTTVTGTLQTASQPNITTLSGITSVGLNNSTTVTGTLQTASQPNITTLSGITSVGLNNSTTITGTLQTANQPNITSVGTLTSLSTNSLTLNGSLITANAAQINYNNITTLGIAEASKALILDSNKDITGIRNLTIAGNLTVSGTTMTINSTQINFTDNILQLNSAPAGSGYDSGIIVQRYQNASDTVLGDVIGQTAKESYTAASVTVSTIVLPSGANATDNYYKNWWIKIQSATTGTNQIRQVSNYTGSTKTITLATNFTTTPTGTIVINLYNKGYSSIIWQEANKRFVTAYSAQDTSAGALTIIDYADLATSNHTIVATTASTSSTTGALIVSGGAGIAGALYVGNSLTVSGNITLNGTTVTATAAQINYNSITTAGTAEASKALILDSNKDITGIRNLTITGALTVNGTNITSGGSTYTNVTTLGVAEASKALILDSNKNITGISWLTSSGLSSNVLTLSSYLYNSVNSTSSASFISNWPYSGYFGIGADSVYSTIKFGTCNSTTGTWSGYANIHCNSIVADSTLSVYGQINGLSNHLFFQTSGVERMRINSSGYVGIGTYSPGYTLDVTGTIRATTYLYTNGYVQTDNGVYTYGWIGIGTNGPSYPLDVQAGYDSSTSFSYRYFSYSGNAAIYSNPLNVSIRCSGRVLCTEVDATSDFRLKENIKPIELEQAKSFVKNIIPKKFNWKTEDKECINFGYIAQDIMKSDIPELVMVNNAPNVETEEYIDPIDGFISPAGTIFSLSRTQIIAILHVTIKDLYNETDNIKSDNEELQNRVTNLENRINTLENDNSELKSENIELNNKNNNLENRINTLENENNQLKEQINNILLRLQNLENN
jgi:hypothetical protein